MNKIKKLYNKNGVKDILLGILWIYFGIVPLLLGDSTVLRNIFVSVAILAGLFSIYCGIKKIIYKKAK